MSIGLTILTGAVGAGILLAVLIALFRSGRPVRGLLGSSVQGICALAAVNVAGTFTGVSLGLNWLTGGVCAVLGIPGVITLLLLKLLFNN